jgi:hypothetical protein
MKWLDPANGIGNFPVAVFYKLDEGLKEWEPNEKKRRKHIIENMIYMIEIQANNTRIAKNIFSKLCEGCTPNIYTTDSTLVTSTKLKSKGWPESYDVVMGNPPFQKGRNMNFYVKFIELAENLLKNKGYLLYVIPNRLLVSGHKANTSILRNFNPLTIYHTINDTYFPSIATTISAVYAKKEDYEGKTKVIFKNGEKEINLKKPTPTQENDIHVKNISDKILLGREYLETSKVKPSGESIYISRVWVRYSPSKPGGGGPHVFQITEPPASGADGHYVKVPTDMTKAILSWFLTRSEAMRFITKIYASAMNVPPFIWEFLPKIALRSESDEEVYELLGLGEKDIKQIKKTLNEEKEVQLEDEETAGGARFNKTRKIRR